MKLTFKNLFAIAMIAFTVSFATGMSASLMYQEHQSLKAYSVAHHMVMEDLSAETDTANFDFS